MLFVAENYKPRISDPIDPAAGPMEVKLAPVTPAAHPEWSVRGRVVNERGEAVLGAMVWRRMVFRANGSGTSRPVGGIEEVAVTNGKGVFAFSSEAELKMLSARVEARGLATEVFGSIEAGDSVNELKLLVGVTVTGHVVRDGRPVAGAAVGLVQVDRRFEHFVGDYKIGTDENGRFQFNNVAPEFDYYVYGIMDSLKERGGVGIRRVLVGKSGTTVDVGDLDVLNAHTIRGSLVLSDGKSVPAGTRLNIGRENAWDFQVVPVEADGTFSACGLPSEVYSIALRVPGYRLSSANASRDGMNGRLLGRVDADIDGLTVLLEPGEWKSATDPAEQMATMDLFKQPLRGADEGLAKRLMERTGK